MTESVSRTFIGSVVCIDLVGYSTKSVAQQIAIKEAFNRLLGQALQRVAAEDRIILDTGDGAAVSFLGDPESGLSVAMALRDTMVANARQLGAARPGEGPVRIGVNLGPMKVALDLNGFPRIVGDGINVAERIAAFAKPGEVVASRSFHDMVSRLSEANAGLFTDRGVHADKNGREHQIYAVAAPGSASARAPAAATTAAPVPARGAFAAFLGDRLKVGFTAALLGVVIALEAAFLLWGGGTATTPTLATTPPPAAAPLAEPARTAPSPAPVAPPVTAPAKGEPVSPKAEPAPPKSEPVPPKVEPTPPKVAQPAPAKAPELSRPAEPVKAAPAAVAKAPEAAPARAEPAAPKAQRRDEPKPARREEPPRPAPVFEPPRPAAPEPPREEPKVAVAAPTTIATPVTKAPVSFPAAAMARNIDRGQVKARLTIDAGGQVREVKILESYPRRYFDEEATRSLREWRFNTGADNRTYDVEIAFQR